MQSLNRMVMAGKVRYILLNIPKERNKTLMPIQRSSTSVSPTPQPGSSARPISVSLRVTSDPTIETFKLTKLKDARDHGLKQFSVYQGQWNAAERDMESDVIPMA